MDEGTAKILKIIFIVAAIIILGSTNIGGLVLVASVVIVLLLEINTSPSANTDYSLITASTLCAQTAMAEGTQGQIAALMRTKAREKFL